MRLHQSIEQIGKRYVAETTIAVVRGRIVNEIHSEGFKTRRAAEGFLSRWALINARALAELAQERETRLRIARDYLARRAERSASTQLNLL